MRVLIIAPCPFFILRGKPIRVLNNSLALALQGHDVTMVTYAEGNPLPSCASALLTTALESIKIRRVRFRFGLDLNRPGLSLAKILNNIVLLFASLRKLRVETYDVIVCHDVDGMLLGLVIGRLIHLPIIYDMHGSFTELMRNIHQSRALTHAVVQRIEKKLYQQADLIVANWPHLVSIASAGKSASKVHLVQDRPPLPIIEQLGSLSKDSTWKDKRGIKSLLLYTGNFANYQRVDILIDMMARMQLDGIDATLALVGDGYRAVSEYAKVQSVRNILFLGPKQGNELIEILSSADLAFSPRTTDAYPPMKVITYLAAGLPIIASDNKGHRTLLQNGRTGFLVAASSEAFAQMAIRLLSNENLRRSVAQAAQLEGQRYSIDSLVAEMGNAFSFLNL